MWTENKIPLVSQMNLINTFVILINEKISKGSKSITANTKWGINDIIYEIWEQNYPIRKRHVIIVSLLITIFEIISFLIYVNKPKTTILH